MYQQMIKSTFDSLEADYFCIARVKVLVNTLRTCDADLRFYVTTVQDG